MTLAEALQSLASRRVVLVGGKGGVGKTTISVAAALQFAEQRETILFTTDPASNLNDLFSEQRLIARLRIEALDASALYQRFLGTHLESFLEIADRGTYLDREELRRFFELALPGVDELMAWMHIGELAEEHPDAIVVVDTAPTGHTLRMLSSAQHFHQLALVLDAMQEKHRALVRQFTRRDVRDAIDAFIDDFAQRAETRHALLTDPMRAAFVPVTLPEPLVVEQTVRLIEEVHAIDVPFVILNRSRGIVPAELARWHVVEAPRACTPLDSPERIAEWAPHPAYGHLLPSARGEGQRGLAPRPAGGERVAEGRVRGARERKLTFFAGKGGVGKTTCAASMALQLAMRHPERRYVAISVDPAHSLRDLFARIETPSNLSVEIIDTKAKWRHFRDTFGVKIEEAVDAFTPRGMSFSHDSEAMQRLIEIAPPGADELFAITRLTDLLDDSAIDGVIVDTAPTGHFLRLLDLPNEAGQWVREFMRILLRYRELIPAGSLGEELVRASRALKELEAALHSERAGVIVVTRPERIVVAETKRLIDDVRGRGIHVGGVIANYVTPENGDACDRSMREHELASLDELHAPVILERRDTPPLTAEALLALVPVE